MVHSFCFHKSIQTSCYYIDFPKTTVDVGMVQNVQKQGWAEMLPYIVQPHCAALAMGPTWKGVALLPTSGSIMHRVPPVV